MQFSGHPISRELELEFRKQQITSDFGIARVVLAVYICGVLFFATSDYRLFGLDHPFPILLGLRAGLVAISLVVWKILRSATELKNPLRFDLALLTHALVTTLSLIYVGATRPATYTGHFLVHVVVVLLFYVAFPMTVRLQAIPALLMSAGITLAAWFNAPQDGLTMKAIMCTLVSVNVLGVSVSRQLHRSRRQLFIAHQHELQMRQQLESALGELKTLRGIIPICSHCHNVRDDAGSWEELAQYVMRHSDAEFSHGICPACLKQHFGAYQH